MPSLEIIRFFGAVLTRRTAPQHQRHLLLQELEVGNRDPQPRLAPELDSDGGDREQADRGDHAHPCPKKQVILAKGSTRLPGGLK